MTRLRGVISVAALMAALLLAAHAAAGEDLARGFARPPDVARPWVYWFWLNGNITREGITADLKAMQRVGIGGVLIMEVDQGTPAGP
ncbi:MAG: glycosyl hydrolase, partial [Armatimonadota bacterium]